MMRDTLRPSFQWVISHWWWHISQGWWLRVGSTLNYVFLIIRLPFTWQLIFHHWSLIKWFTLCLTIRPLFTQWDLCYSLGSIFIISIFPCLYWYFYFLLFLMGSFVVSFSFGAYERCTLVVSYINFYMIHHILFGFVLVLVDKGFIKALVLMSLIPSTLSHYLGTLLAKTNNNLGSVDLDGKFPCFQ